MADFRCLGYLRLGPGLEGGAFLVIGVTMFKDVRGKLSIGGRVTGTSSRAAYRFLLDSIGFLEFGMVGGERRPGGPPSLGLAWFDLVFVSTHSWRSSAGGDSHSISWTSERVVGVEDGICAASCKDDGRGGIVSGW